MMVYNREGKSLSSLFWCSVQNSKTYNENTFTADLTIYVKLKKLRQLKALAVNNGYINIG